MEQLSILRGRSCRCCEGERVQRPPFATQKRLREERGTLSVTFLSLKGGPLVQGPRWATKHATCRNQNLRSPNPNSRNDEKYCEASLDQLRGTGSQTKCLSSVSSPVCSR